MTTIRIRNMVCGRCIKAVGSVFEREGVRPVSVELGTVKLAAPLKDEQLLAIRVALEAEGFEILDDQKARLAEDIRLAIIELVHYGQLDEMKLNLSSYLSGKLNREYSQLSNLFSAVENTTIEHFFILQKIEKVKEWLVYNEFTLSEIAFKLGYSSTAHLSAQFRKITGFTPSQFKQLKDHHRSELDKI
jgi:AraC family transcriptional regulator